MPRQLVIACDAEGRRTGEYVDRTVAHLGTGRTHLAIVALLSDDRGRVLIQRRKHALFDGLWDWTGATHPLLLDDGREETIEESALRCIQQEYRVEGAIDDVRSLGGLPYFAPHGEHCENEFCYVVAARLRGAITPKDDSAYDVRWMALGDLLAAMDREPELFTPWALAGSSIVEHLGSS